MSDKATSSSLLRALPSVDALLRSETARGLRDAFGVEHLATVARVVTEELRAEIQAQAARGEGANGRRACVASSTPAASSCTLTWDARLCRKRRVTLSRTKLRATARWNTTCRRASVDAEARASNNCLQS
jgi:hypothetical protein